MVSAWAHHARLVLAQRKVSEKSNEITARYAEKQRWHDVEHEQHRTVDGTHGRIKERHCWVIPDPDVLTYLNPKQAWAGLAVSAWWPRNGMRQVKQAMSAASIF